MISSVDLLDFKFSKVDFFAANSGKNPVQSFIFSLPIQDQVKCVRLLMQLEKYGVRGLPNHCKKLVGTPLFELRILGRGSIRLLFWQYRNGEIILLHGFSKKSQKTPLKEISVALARLAEWKLLLDY